MFVLTLLYSYSPTMTIYCGKTVSRYLVATCGGRTQKVQNSDSVLPIYNIYFHLLFLLMTSSDSEINYSVNLSSHLCFHSKKSPSVFVSVLLTCSTISEELTHVTAGCY